MTAIATAPDAALRAELRQLRRERVGLDARIDAIERELRQRAGLKRLRGRRPVAVPNASVDVLMPIARMRNRR
jgi:hypothetical protein